MKVYLLASNLTLNEVLVFSLDLIPELNSSQVVMRLQSSANLAPARHRQRPGCPKPHVIPLWCNRTSGNPPTPSLLTTPPPPPPLKLQSVSKLNALRLPEAGGRGAEVRLSAVTWLCSSLDQTPRLDMKREGSSRRSTHLVTRGQDRLSGSALTVSLLGFECPLEQAGT